MPELLPYQIIGKDWLKKHKIAYLGDVMGLGKTAQAIRAAQELVEEKIIKGDVLIVCPAVVKETWMEELEKWGATFNCTLSSYASLKKVKGKFSLIIADEAHKAKNLKAMRTKLLYSFATNTKRVWMLSGTPITKCTIDIFPYAKFSGVYPGNYYQFAERYCEKHLITLKGRIFKQYKGGKNLRELKEMLKPVMLRRFAKDVLKELPEKIHNEIILGKESTTKYVNYMEDVENTLTEQKASPSLSRDDKTAIATLRKELGIEKVKGAMSFINSIIEDTDEQILIFAHHRDVLKRIQHEYHLQGRTTDLIIGGQKDTDRKEILKRWREGKTQILIISLEAAIGLTLIEATKAFFVELPWNPDTVDQAMKRIHRIGQKEVTNIYFLLQSNSFDMAVKRTILNKRRIIHGTIGATA